MEERYVEKKYTNVRNKGSFSGLKKFKTEQKLKNKVTKKVLSSIPAYSYHKSAPIRFQRRKVISLFVNQIYCSDLIDLQKLSRFNRGQKWLCVVLDIFSRYLYGFPLPNKTAASVKKGFQDFFQKNKVKPLLLQTDFGNEYYGKEFREYLKTMNIKHYSVYTKLKASVCERVNLTILKKLHRYFTFAKTKNWIDVIQQLINAYNNEKHRSLGMTPTQARKKENHEKVQQALYGDMKINKKPIYKVNDRVLLSKNKMVFSKSYKAQFGDEVFTVHAIKYSNPVTYIIADSNNNIIPGAFYKEQLQKVD